MTIAILPLARGRRTTSLLGLLVVLGFSVLWFAWSSNEGFPLRDGTKSYGSEELPALPAPAALLSESDLVRFHECRTAQGADDIFVAMKIGSVEAYHKLPQHLLTTFRCIPHYSIFSDLEQNVSGQYIYDSFANVDGTIQDLYEEFQYYRNIHEAHANGEDIAITMKEEAKGNKRMGWKLDKWKWLPMLRKSYELHPHKSWYLFVEADTAIIWTNLLQWIQRLDPEKEIYSGAQNAQGNLDFAHGGSGVLVSQAAMRRLLEEYPLRSDKWQSDTADACCGDVALGLHFLDAKIALAPSFPLLQGERPMTVDWNRRHMCTPSVSWHHMAAMDVDMLWILQMNWTQSHGWNKPYLFRDLFTAYVDRYIRDRIDFWDNISADIEYVQPQHPEEDETWKKLITIERQSVESFQACRLACYANEKCLQFRFQPGRCALGENIRIGKMVLNNKMSSGWLLERVQEFKTSFDDCKANWAFNQ